MEKSQSKNISIVTIEKMVFAAIWIMLFSLPFLLQQSATAVLWEKVFVEWLRIFSFFVIFIVNIAVFVPRLLFRKKYSQYIVSVLFLIMVVNFTSSHIRFRIIDPIPVAMPRMELGPGMPPMELGQNMPAPKGYRLPQAQEKPSELKHFVNGFLISLLVVGASVVFKMISKWLDEEKLRKDVEKEQLRTELAFLRHQVSPHFFMNTLNNIHALIDINTDTAKDAVIRLSTMMRYLLYETSQGKTTLQKEIAFIQSYISLMQLRFSNKVNINVALPSHVPQLNIPPMLFISLLENAFKHGVSYQSESYIDFSLQIEHSQLLCSIKNSKHASQKSTQSKDASGIGLSNIRKSLSLLYADNYDFLIDETENSFEVKLKIPIYEY